jgi:hypothetical protein
MSRGTHVEGVAGTVGTTRGGVSSCSVDDEGTGAGRLGSSRNGNERSSKITCREVMTRPEERS